MLFPRFIIQYNKRAAPHMKIIAPAGSLNKVEHTGMEGIGIDISFC